MASLSELQSYQGNAALGAGGGGNVLPQKSDFDNINRAGEMWALQQVNANKAIFDQKIKDRDYKRKLFEEGQIKVGAHLDNDNPIITKAQKEVNDAYEKFVNAPPNDTKALQEYQNAHTKYSDIVTEAQSRYNTIHEQKQAIADEPNAAKKAEMQAHLDKQMSKGFGYNIDPYQKALDFNVTYAPDIATKYGHTGWGKGAAGTNIGTQGETTGGKVGETGGVVTPPSQSKTSTTVTKGAKGTTVSTKTTNEPTKGQVAVSSPADIKMDAQGRVYVKQPEEHFNFSDVKNGMAKVYADPKSNDHEEMDKGVQMFDNIDGFSQAQILKSIFNAAERYNTQLAGTEGFKPIETSIFDGTQKLPTEAELKDPNYKIPEYIAVKDANGKYKLKISAAEYAALQVLANQPTFKTGGYVFDEKATEDAEKRRHNKEIEGIDWYKARKQAEYNRKKIESLNGDDVVPFLKDQWKDNILGVLGAVGTTDDKKKVYSSLVNIPANKTMPIFTLESGKEKLFEPIGAKPIYELGYKDPDTKKVDNTRPADEKDKLIGYQGGHYESQYYKSDGNAISIDALGQTYRETVNTLRDKKIKNIPTFDEYVKGLVKSNAMKYGLRGAKQTINEDTYIENQKMLSNKYSKKGQNIFAGDESNYNSNVNEGKDNESTPEQ